MMENWYYLSALVISICGLLVLDHRYRLAFWYDTLRTGKVLLIAIAVFVVWDAVGIWLGIFFKGDSNYTLPFEIAPEFPLEEVFFLFLLTYVTLLIFRGAQRWQLTS